MGHSYLEEQIEKINKEYKHLIVETDIYELFHEIKPDDITVSEMLGEMLQHKTYLRISINLIRRKRQSEGKKKFDKVFT